MSDICKNAISFLQKRFPTAIVSNCVGNLSDLEGNIVEKIWPMIAFDPQSGIKQRAIAIDCISNENDLQAIATSMQGLFNEINKSAYIKIGNAIKPSGHEIDTNQMVFSARVILYTGELTMPIQDDVTRVFDRLNTLIDVVSESDMHKTLFISYGGPDEEDVIKINSLLKAKGISTQFFPNDALPGDKLHRVMHDGVNSHDRVLLVCSENALTRPGVLNEIERVLEREAKEGGSDILIPITLDKFVYSDWASEREDIASQIRNRVITKIDCNSDKFENQVDKVVSVLRN